MWDIAGIIHLSLITQTCNTDKTSRTVSLKRDSVFMHVTSTDHSPTDNVPVTDNQCYESVIVGSSVQHHDTVSSTSCYETVTRTSIEECIVNR